ncbi:PadR family transcriptional regulator [Paenibacillus algorifonticola]|uniref:PadR family transcriptional regulator n=1 Tax=Paenibacillus algorifonticola TaxID=684063 RepID=UPI003D2AE6FB
MPIEKEILKGYIDIIILSLLFEKDMYGYEMAKMAHHKSQFELKEGTMYLSLKRMEKNGLIESYWNDSESGGSRRKYYKILSEGVDRLRQKKQEWIEINQVLSTFLEGVE